MELVEKLKSMSMQHRDDVAKKAGLKSGEYLRQLAYGHNYASITTAETLEQLLGVKGAEEIVSESNKKILARLRAESNAA